MATPVGRPTVIQLFLLIFIFGWCLIDAMIIRDKRQTYVYDESLRQYARPHPRTRIMTGTVGLYAPQDWPAWYTRTIFKWNGDVRLGPYHPNDARYDGYQRSRIHAQNF